MGFTPSGLPSLNACHLAFALSPSAGVTPTENAIKWRTTTYHITEKSVLSSGQAGPRVDTALLSAYQSLWNLPSGYERADAD